MLWWWLSDEKQLLYKFSYVNNQLYSVIDFNHVKLRYIEPCNLIFSPDIHWWANKARSWLLRTLTIHNVSIYQSIYQRLSLSLYNTHPTWLSLTNEFQFVDYCHQITSLSWINLLLLINKFSSICEEQSCRVCIFKHHQGAISKMHTS